MSASPTRGTVKLALADSPTGGRETFWAGPLVALGAMANRHASGLKGRQLVVVVSVPRRDFAAVLLGCGWHLMTRAPELQPALSVLRSLEHGSLVRVVTETDVVVDTFVRLEERSEPYVKLHDSNWLLAKVHAVVRLDEFDGVRRSPRPPVGSLARWGRLESSWDRRLAAPPRDLTIVGTLKWLNDDLQAFLTTVGADDDPVRPGPQDAIGSMLLPRNGSAATWFTEFRASSRLGHESPINAHSRAVVLDGNGAVRYLGEIEAPVVFCVLDRSIADDGAAELVAQLRNTRGVPASLSADLGWPSPAGIEAFAFTVAA